MHSAITPAQFPGVDTTATSTVGFESSDDESALGGDSVIAQQTTFASELLEHAVERTSLHDVGPKMWEALTDLRQIAELQSRQSISHGPRFPLQQPLPKGGLGQLRLPPMDVVVSLLKRVKASPPGLFTFVCYFVGISDFSNLCRMVYFPSDDFTDSTFVIVNVGLYYLFLEQHSLAMDRALKDEFASHLHTSRVNLETGLANMSLFMSVKIETVQSLIMGTLYSIDVCRPSVAWHLNSAAAQMCQTAGFHRKEHAMRNPEDAGIKSILFWYIYTTDKALAIRLGRAPVIQDWEVDIPRTFNFEGILSLETKAVASMWLSAATLQGQVYEQLFCPAALAQPPAVLVERALSLAAQCRQVEAEAQQSREMAIASLEKIGASPLVDVHLKGDEVQLLSTMTLIYRAIPAPEGSASRFCDECIDTARRATNTHLACMELVRKDPHARNMYVHWNLVLTPFAPFFVLFCFVIETMSAKDLSLLKEFSTSIEETSDASETMQKLSRLCNLMSNVAALYVEAKSQQQEDQTMVPIGDEFDVYLSQLGFMPVMDPNMNAAGGDPNAAFAESSQVTQMADWMSGSRNLLGLLEQDISQIGGPQWPPM
ncbi:C6 transcription factor [Fusarium heterosporum]|uniref:C6 transcription factor n=1 Tax=Fusarium heterosporum TaxID=42747 RepID=A0A8H5TZQ8_FUSHE|nr:C6 transcription factor [Fusarium heterosporum]